MVNVGSGGDFSQGGGYDGIGTNKGGAWGQSKSGEPSWQDVIKSNATRSSGSKLPPVVPHGKTQGFNQQGGGNSKISQTAFGFFEVGYSYSTCIKQPMYDVKCVTINLIVKSNGELVMGAGTALTFKNQFPGVSYHFGKIVKYRKNKSQLVVENYCKDGSMPTWLVGVPTKYNWKDPSPPALVYESLLNLTLFCDMVGAKKVLLPAPGCGHGGLSWEKDVKPMMSKIPGFDERFYVCV